ncbi:MAG: cation:proton antiporter [Firmicutes bacterium]|nr:cation:proton antiporter [Bacillota bacterium]
MELAKLIVDLAWILIIAGVTTLICKKLKQPVIIGYVLAGFLLSPVTEFFPMFVGSTEEIEVLADIGVIFLMFTLGLEFNLHKMMQVGVSGTLSAAIQIIGMVFVGYLVGMLLGWSATDSLFLGGMLSMSSTIITVKAIEDCNMMDRKFSSLAIGTLIIEDIAAIFLMMVLSTVSVSQGGGADLFVTIGKLLFYLAFWLVVGILILPTLIQKIQHLLSGETLLIVALAVCFGMVLIAEALGFTEALGAFMAGSLLAGTSVAEKTEKLVTPCKDLFVAVFFVSVGFLVVPSTLVEYAVPILILIVATIIFKILFLGGSYLLTRQDLDTSVHCALSQTQVGEFSFVIASLGLSLGVTGEFLYPVIVAVALITTFTTPFLLRGAVPFTHFLEKHLPEKALSVIEARSRKEEEENDPKQKEISAVWRRYLKRYFMRICLFTLVGAGLVFLGKGVLLPFALEYFPFTATKIVVMLVVMGILMPFIPPLVISNDPGFATLWVASPFNKLPLTVLMGIRFAFAVGLLMLVPIMFFDHIPFWLLFLMIPIAFMAGHSKRLRGSYLNIAAKFMTNLNEKQLLENSKKEQLLWESDNLIVDVYRVPEDSPLIGRSLAELEWGRTFRLNVIRTRRGKKVVNLPPGSEILREGDYIAVYGALRSIENFRLIYSERALLFQGEETLTLGHYIKNQGHIQDKDQLYCYGILIKKGSSYVGKSIRDSGLKNNRQCFVIGVERELLPMTEPSPNLILRADDILWLLGTVETVLYLLEDDTITYHSANAKPRKA